MRYGRRMKFLDHQKLDVFNQTRSNVFGWRGPFQPEFVAQPCRLTGRRAAHHLRHCRLQRRGHHVPAMDIRRRFRRSLVNLPDDYLPLATRWAIWDSRSLPAKRLAISSTHDIAGLRKVICP
jgi:hypothetical protein